MMAPGDDKIHARKQNQIRWGQYFEKCYTVIYESKKG
jgi:hypothetical protein